MKVYVAAKFSDKDRVKEVYSMLKRAGYSITHEWIHNKSSYPFDNDIVYSSQCAQEDIEGVIKADIFILLSHVEPSLGASAELGAAIAHYIAFKKPAIYVVGPHFQDNFVFYHPAVMRKNSIEEMLLDMAKLANERTLLDRRESGRL